MKLLFAFILIVLLITIYYINNTKTMHYNINYFIKKIFNKLTGENTEYPKHIAFIMDGNGRWAKKQNKERTYGHSNGVNNLFDIFNKCFVKGSTHLSFYVFSEQNWKRPNKEITHIFNVLYKKLKIFYLVHEVIKYRILIQGKLNRIPKKLRKLLLKLMEETKEYKKTIILCIDYSGRSEILNTCKKLIDNHLEPTLENFNKNMYVPGIPDPDLIIRTSGEKRVSDFLLWQLSYSELYFTDVYWPDFDLNELDKAIFDYNSRERRYGDVL
jgi:undecaprenyl diphosphate synthase